MENQYDSAVDTLLHIKRVSQLLTESCTEIIRRANCHDQSKLESPEKEYFDKYTPELAGLVYPSEEYTLSKAKLGPALEHHYAKNTHHPQHYENGIDGMNLFDVIEMFFDWKASSERQNNGNLCKSITHNQKEYKMSDQLVNIFKNTATFKGW